MQSENLPQVAESNPPQPTDAAREGLVYDKLMNHISLVDSLSVYSAQENLL